MSPTRYHCATPLRSLNLWRPHEDLNPELLITKQAFYRLNYGAFNMVEMVGIEPCCARAPGVLTFDPASIAHRDIYYR